ncbi:hypothetical protein PENSTE_c014G06435 [Penicillium steckii]|uniref:SP-RING-type domain-containing protein n=1 Tax=Penicillium steckii TaxID=303698 RepID=A0A1V6T233_9EURO|nr:hypothetical protein PENSTE_c014G06435 [Penicillium steckii]
MTSRQSLRGVDQIEDSNSTASLFLGGPRRRWMPFNQTAPQPSHLNGPQNAMSSSVTATSTESGPRKLSPRPPLAATAGQLISPVTPGAILPSHVEVSTLPQPSHHPSVNFPSPDPSTGSHNSPNGSHQMVATGSDQPQNPQNVQNIETIPRENQPNETSASNLGANSIPTQTPTLSTSHPNSIQSIRNPAGPTSQGPQTIQTDHCSSDDILNEDTWRRWHPKFAALCDQVHNSTNLAVRRTILLNTAYEKRDHFYLVLHQSFCRWSADTLPPDFNSSAVLHGFQRLEGLLIANNMLPAELKSTFAEIPDKPENLMHAAWYRKTLAEVRTCLTCLAEQHRKFIDHQLRSGFYHNRQFPPLAAELAAFFNVSSPVLLKVLFASTCRLLYDFDKLPGLEMLFQEEMAMLENNPELVGLIFPVESLVEKYKAIAMKPLGLGLQSQPQPQSHSQPQPQPQHQHQHEHQHQHQQEVGRRESSGAGSPLDAQIFPSNSIMPVPSGPNLPSRPPQNLVAASLPSQIIPTTRQHTSQPISPVVPGSRRVSQQQAHRQIYPAYLQQPATLPTQPQSQNNSQWAQPVPMQNPRLPQTPTTQTYQFPQTQQAHYGSAYHSGLQPYAAHSPGPPRGYFSVHQPPPQGQTPGQQLPVNIPHQTSRMGQPQVPHIQNPHGRQIVSQHPQSPPQKPPTPLLPPPGYKLPPTVQPNPMRLGLHQADLREPIKKLKHWGPNGFADVGELFYYMDGFAMPPTFMSSDEISFSRTFEISATDMQSAPRLEVNTHHPARPATCFYQPGCKSIRLRAIAQSNSHKDQVFDLWPTQNTSWPSVFYIHVNGKELFVRRKAHNGKDLPLDITPHLIEGENKLSLHFLLEPGECKNFRYVFGIERMQTLDFDQVRQQACTIPADETRQRIEKRLSPSGEDDDLTVVSQSLTVGLIDPFMAQIFKTPARSKHCKHLECFDLDTFISTRRSESGPAAMNDNWQCPICKADARPMHLTIDEFFVNIRAELVSNNRLEEDIVAIDVRADGSWTAKVVSDENTSYNETMPGSNKRKASESLNKEASPQKQPSPVINKEPVLIELD